MLRQLSEMQKVMLDQMKAGGGPESECLDSSIISFASVSLISISVGATASAAEDAGTAAVASAAATAAGGGPEEAQFAQAFLQNLNFLAERAQKIQVS